MIQEAITYIRRQCGSPDNVLELDEVWSLVLNTGQKFGLWIALCRRLWNTVPLVDQAYSDFWDVCPAVGKKSSQTAQVGRWNNTLRQRMAKRTILDRRFSA